MGVMQIKLKILTNLKEIRTQTYGTTKQPKEMSAAKTLSEFMRTYSYGTLYDLMGITYSTGDAFLDKAKSKYCLVAHYWHWCCCCLK